MSGTLFRSNLVELDISNNKDISDTGGEAIVRALKQNMNRKNRLKEINVSNTSISFKIKQEMEKYVVLTERKTTWSYMKELSNKE